MALRLDRRATVSIGSNGNHVSAADSNTCISWSKRKHTQKMKECKIFWCAKMTFNFFNKNIHLKLEDYTDYTSWFRLCRFPCQTNGDFGRLGWQLCASVVLPATCSPAQGRWTSCWTKSSDSNSIWENNNSNNQKWREFTSTCCFVETIRDSLIRGK